MSLKYPEINGSWETDPLDLKGLRLDAELEAREKAEEEKAILDKGIRIAIDDYKSNCKDCRFGRGSPQCENCYVGGF